MVAAPAGRRCIQQFRAKSDHGVVAATLRQTEEELSGCLALLWVRFPKQRESSIRLALTWAALPQLLQLKRMRSSGTPLAQRNLLRDH